MAIAAGPRPKSISDVKRNLLHPALTSLYYVEIDLPSAITTGGYLKANIGQAYDQEKLNLMCCEATLPGSNLATLDLTNDHTGVTERHVYRRVYDDRIDLTFYVDAENYISIRVFETWMKYIVQESVAKNDQQGKPSSEDKTYFYSVQYPDKYMSLNGLKITKFEKNSFGDGKNSGSGGIRIKNDGLLTYTFVRSFPISISSMPVSYDSSNLLKCTVSMSYIRYVVNQAEAPQEGIPGNATSNQGNANLGTEVFTNPKYNLDIGNLFSPQGQALLNTNQAINSGYGFPPPSARTNAFTTNLNFNYK